MNTDVEDLLREGMERFTRDLRAPAGMTHQAVRQRRRRLVLRSAAGAAAALAACAVALAAVGVPGARRDGPVVDAAYVVNRVDSALSTADPADIAQMRVTIRSAATPGGMTVTTTAEEWSYGDQWRSVTYSSAGQPVYDEGFSAASVYTLVSYPARTWARQPGFGRPAAAAFSPRGCTPAVTAVPLVPVVPVARLLFQPGLPGIGFSASLPPATVAGDLRTAVSCGTLVVAGRQRIDGIEAIKLTSRPGSPISETIWVSPGTYLPLRVLVSAPGTPGLQQTADITWLPPTAQNLAKLTVPIPAGFRQVSLAEAVGQTLLHLPGWPLLNSTAPCPVAPADLTCQDRTSAFGSGPASLAGASA